MSNTNEQRKKKIKYKLDVYKIDTHRWDHFVFEMRAK